jgi:hypothetical protein
MLNVPLSVPMPESAATTYAGEVEEHHLGQPNIFSPVLRYAGIEDVEPVTQGGNNLKVGDETYRNRITVAIARDKKPIRLINIPLRWRLLLWQQAQEKSYAVTVSRFFAHGCKG